MFTNNQIAAPAPTDIRVAARKSESGNQPSQCSCGNFSPKWKKLAGAQDGEMPADIVRAVVVYSASSCAMRVV